MAKHKAATEITIAQEEQSAFAAMVFKYKWPALTTLAVASAAILYVQSASEAATESKRAEWGQLFEASSSDDPIVALEEFTAQNPEGAAAASAFMNQALLHLDEAGGGEGLHHPLPRQHARRTHRPEHEVFLTSYRSENVPPNVTTRCMF